MRSSHRGLPAARHPVEVPEPSAERLLPCPFCGSEAEIVQVGNEHTRERGFDVRCTGQLCRTTHRSRVIRRPLEWLRPKMIERWNTRAAGTEEQSFTLTVTSTTNGEDVRVDHRLGPGSWLLARDAMQAARDFLNRQLAAQEQCPARPKPKLTGEQK